MGDFLVGLNVDKKDAENPGGRGPVHPTKSFYREGHKIGGFWGGRWKTDFGEWRKAIK